MKASRLTRDKRYPAVYVETALPSGAYQSSLSPALTACAQFCLRHSATARRLRFLRKVPPLRGLADAALLAAAASMAEHEFAVSPAEGKPSC